MKIGFIGMGIMGVPMALHLHKANYEVMVYNRSIEKTLPLQEAGAKVAGDLEALASFADIIILMLSDHHAIEESLFSEQGLLSHHSHIQTIINMSTVSPEYSKNLAEKLKQYQLNLIDAPVSGSKKPAQEGQLVILASGEEEQIKTLEPMFLTMGKKVIYCGEAGQGSAMKMAINLLLGTMMTGLAEALTLGEKSGLKTETLLEVILAGPLSCDLFKIKKDMLLHKDYPPQFPLKHITKDLGLIMDTADQVQANVPVGHSIFQLYQQAMQENLGEADFAAIKKVLEG